MGHYSKNSGHYLSLAQSTTIAAIATPPGRGGIGIVRVSGPAVQLVMASVLHRQLEPRRAHLTSFHNSNGESIDKGIALFFPAPHSYTSEDVLELQAHGSPVALDLLLSAVCEAGAQLAEPGEFTRRAFLNGRLDLAQAEAVADLIEAASAKAARAAVRTLEGSFSDAIASFDVRLAELRAYIEADIDFADEEIDFLAESDVLERITALQADLANLCKETKRGSILNNGVDVVIAGAPNVGKSSLLNRLANRDAAIVTPVPGTTRDLLHETVVVDGLAFRFTDTAGLRSTQDIVESEGIERARRAAREADLLIHVRDDRYRLTPPNEDQLALPTGIPTIVVHNKIDLSGAMSERLIEPPLTAHSSGTPLAPIAIRLSAFTGDGLDLLIHAIKEVIGYDDDGESNFTARRRHLIALGDVSTATDNAARRLHNGSESELVAEELRLAQQALARIVGERSNEDLLGLIFSTFCLGK